MLCVLFYYILHSIDGMCNINIIFINKHMVTTNDSIINYYMPTHINIIDSEQIGREITHVEEHVC